MSLATAQMNERFITLFRYILNEFTSTTVSNTSTPRNTFCSYRLDSRPPLYPFVSDEFLKRSFIRTKKMVLTAPIVVHLLNASVKAKSFINWITK